MTKMQPSKTPAAEPKQQDTLPVIDFHVHCWMDKFAPLVIRHFKDYAGLTPYFDGTVAGLEKSMEQGGITASVVLPVPTNPKQVDKYNDFFANYIGNPRIIPFAGVHPDETDPVATVRRAARAGFKGIKLHPLNQSFDPDEERMFPVYRAALEEGMIILFHGGSGFVAPAKFGNHDSFSRLFDKFNDADQRIVLAHMGGPYSYDTQPEPDPQWPCWFDIAFLCNTYTPQEVEGLIRLVGIERTLFGTDAPWHSQESDAQVARRLSFSQDELAAIMAGNAMRLLGIATQWRQNASSVMSRRTGRTADSGSVAGAQEPLRPTLLLPPWRRLTGLRPRQLR